MAEDRNPTGTSDQRSAAADGQPEQSFGGVAALSQANALLSSLHDVVRSMTTPLSVEELIPSLRSQLGEVFRPDTIVLLSGDPASGRMGVVHAEGARIAASVETIELPAVLARGPRGRPLLRSDLAGVASFGPATKAGAYAWLFSRGRASGLLALERDDDEELHPTAAETLERLSLPLALALDNAMWFRRLRTLGAEEERQRLGATLHDRFAQSLAYVAMSLDRAGRRHPDDGELVQLRHDVRATLGELRETLHELRLTVDDEHGLEDALRDHLGRVEEMHGVIASVKIVDDVSDVSQGIAQQLLRIAQDLTALAAREQGATTVTITLTHPPGRVVMAVADDGLGHTEQELGREARSRLASVRERVDAIGGRVAIHATQGEGTAISIELRSAL
jgi:signal transduction histidine kinase